jgi:erythronate-4-phosphate dehydrogenase
MKKIIIESHIPYVGDVFNGIAEAQFLPPEEITPAAVKNADALIVRTRTRCNAELLDNSNGRFVATATIGTDHIDIPYCNSRGIEVVSAPGCNAPAVAQYVWASVLSVLSLRKKLCGLTIGIVGLGHVGSIVAKWAKALGVKVLACDPPRQLAHGGWDENEPLLAGDNPFVSLDEVARKSNIITIHTPHTTTGQFPTHHMVNSSFLNSLEKMPILINAARGPIFDTEAVFNAVIASQLSGCVVDCWEDEPSINRNFLTFVDIATPHIAGYSIQGKQRATAAVVAAALRFFGAEEALAALPPIIPSSDPKVDISPEAILASYNPLADNAALRVAMAHASNPADAAAAFERLRNTYPLRPELGF